MRQEARFAHIFTTMKRLTYHAREYHGTAPLFFSTFRARRSVWRTILAYIFN